MRAIRTSKQQRTKSQSKQANKRAMDFATTFFEQDPEFLVAAEIVEYVEPQILGPSSFESGAVVVSKYLFDVENGTCSQWTEAVVNADQITTITLAGRARGGGGFGVSTLAHNLRSRVMRLLTGSYAQ